MSLIHWTSYRSAQEGIQWFHDPCINVGRLSTSRQTQAFLTLGYNKGTQHQEKARGFMMLCLFIALLYLELQQPWCNESTAAWTAIRSVLHLTIVRQSGMKQNKIKIEKSLDCTYLPQEDDEIAYATVASPSITFIQMLLEINWFKNAARQKIQCISPKNCFF